MRRLLLLSLFILSVLSFRVTALTVPQRQITNVTPDGPKTDLLSDNGLQICDAGLMSLNDGPVKAPSRSADEWIPFGTAFFNEPFNNYFGSEYTPDSPVQVYFRAVSDVVWELKLCNFLNSDIIINSNLRLGQMEITRQQTGISSPYAGDGNYDNYTIFAQPFNANPFCGTIELPIWLLVAPNSGWDLRSEGYTMTITLDGQWQNFGSATPNETFIRSIRTLAPALPIESKAHVVDYMKLNDNLWLFMIRGLAGVDLPIVSYIDKRVSVAVNTDLGVESDYSGYGDPYYKNWHIFSYFAGTPRDGNMWFPYYLSVSPGTGYDIRDADILMSFVSDLISVFEVIDGDCFADADDSTVKIRVKRSDNVVSAKIEFYYLTYDANTGSSVSETLIDDIIPISGDNTIELPLSKGRGVYMARVFGYDGTGAFGTQKTIIVYADPSDGHSWENIGKGLFRPTLLAYCWPDSRAPWLEVEIEKASGANLYRMINPYRQPEVAEKLKENYSLVENKDTYIYFGEDNDYSKLQNIGLINNSGRIPYDIVTLSSDQNANEGIYNLNIGEVTLPGIKNYSIVLTSANTAMASPHVKDVIYCVIPAEKATEFSYGLDSKAWIDSKAVPSVHANPDASGNIRFDNSQCNGTIHLIAIATLDDNQTPQCYIHSLLSEGNGWINVGTFDTTPFASLFFPDVTGHDYASEVCINPFDRNIVRLTNPFKFMDGYEDQDLFTDFSSDKHVYLSNSPAGYVYSSDASGKVENIGSVTGIAHRYSDNEFAPDVTQAEIWNYVCYYFQCETNALYRSGYTDKRIEETIQRGNSVPVRVGSLLVFPAYRSSLYSLRYGNIPLGSYFIYAPADSDRDFSISGLSSDNKSFTVGADISSVKLVISKAEEFHPDIYEILFGDIETVGLPVSDGRTESIDGLEEGSYSYTAIAYDADGNVANAVTGTVDFSSGISDIIVDEENAPAVYYNLQGVQVANPDNGIYIVRRGNKVTKEIIRK